jgi:hypothetical protein
VVNVELLFSVPEAAPITLSMPKEAVLEDDEVDLRSYRPAGGPILLHAIELPPQAKSTGNWTVRKGE